MHAVKNGSTGVFQLLMDHGVDLEIESEVSRSHGATGAASCSQAVSSMKT